MLTSPSTGLLVDRPELFIDGAWAAPQDGGVIEVINPATEELAGRVGEASPADIDRAVTAARRTFDEGVWRRQSPADRGAVLRRAADILQSRFDELVDILTAELGVPRWYTEMAHVPNPIRNLRYYADLAESFQWEEWRGDGSARSLVVSEPVGVVGAITPWNGPLSNPMLKAAPALAAGCSVVSKPAPDAPLSMVAVADALHEAGLPAGVFNLVPADREAGESLVRHPEVDKVAFTGSTAAGKRIMAICADGIKRVTLELGGKSAAIVLEDANVDQLASVLPPLLLAVNGQACIAQSRVLVPRSREREIVEALTAVMAQTRVGDPLDPDTVVGPLVSARQRERVEGFFDTARSEGAQVTTGGGRPAGLARGFYVEPTVLASVTNGMRVAQEEIFGPVMSIISYDTPEQAIAIANDSPYGLSGSVWAADEERALGVAREIRTGMVSINGLPQAFGTPFGGFKQSGIGREMGPEGLRLYTELKSIAMSPEAA
jgi:betaine-aldehyde dehydrogenase